MKKIFKTMAFIFVGLVLSSNLMAEKYKDVEVGFTSATAPTGWSTNGTFNSSYYKMTTGQYAETSSITTIIPEGEVLDSDFKVNVACGTFGTWSNPKSVTVTTSLLDDDGTTLSSGTQTYSNLNSTQGTYRGDITITKPSDVSKIAKLKIVFSDFTTGTELRFAKLKLNYSTKSADVPSKTETTTTFGVGVDDQTFDAEVGGTFEGKTATVSPVVGASVTYSSSVPAVASVDANTGAITINAKGTTDITATYAGDDTYAGSSAKYTISVTNSNEVVLLSEDWSDGTTGYTLVNGGSNTKTYNEALAGGTSPELLVGKNTGSVTTPAISLTGSTGPYTLTYKANNANLSVSSSTEGVSVGAVSLLSGTTYTCTITVPAKTTSMTLTFSNSESGNTRLDDIELVGTAAATTYSIEFDGNGATSGSMATIEGIEPNSSKTLPANAFVKTGYNFAGWKDQDNNEYSDEATISNINDFITLTAQWTAKVLEITLDKNGSSEDGLAIATYDATSIPDADFLPVEAWAGHNLLGYYTSNEGGDKVLNVDGTFAGNVVGWIEDGKWAKAENATLYAQWETIAQYSVEYDLTGCTANASNPTEIALEATTATLNFDLIAGYVWTDAAFEVTMGGVELAATEYTFTEGELVITPAAGFNGNIVVTIICDYASVVLTLSENGEETPVNSKLNTAITLPTTSTQACEGKVFVGWSATAIDGETDVEPTLLDATYTFTDPEQLTKTIYAVYAKEQKGSTSWNKVPTDYTDWVGNEFMIVYESSATNGYVMKQADAVSNYVEATITSGVIASKPNDAMSVIIEKFGSTDNYQIKVAGANPASYLKGASGNGLSFDASAQQTTISYDNTNGWLISNNSSWLRYNTTSGQTRFRFYKSSTYTGSSYKSVQFYKKTAGESSYSKYCTTCQAAVAVPTFSLAEGEYDEAKTLTLSAAEGDIYYTINDGEETKYTTAIALNNRGTYEISAYAKVDTRTSETVTKTYTLDWPYTLDELAASDVATGTQVQVTFENKKITNFYTNSQGKRYGIYVDVQKGDKNVEIYCNKAEHPDTWSLGGFVSTTQAISGTWTYFERDSQWQFCPNNWENISYTAPAGPATNLNNVNANKKATKAIVNGQIVIVRDGKAYNVLGF